jgi:hypothetical protein
LDHEPAGDDARHHRRRAAERELRCGVSALLAEENQQGNVGRK